MRPGFFHKALVLHHPFAEHIKGACEGLINQAEAPALPFKGVPYPPPAGLKTDASTDSPGSGEWRISGDRLHSLGATDRLHSNPDFEVVAMDVALTHWQETNLWAVPRPIEDKDGTKPNTSSPQPRKNSPGP
jgi:hypothetical protein